ncbi:MAG: prepilin-type N-terminal cleavage/methylation domain-containing protein [Candidatus Omnitrophica bacterium]|nr:prepilin-type N-terminal cleavage/methylation domain-containing protein [Candidatus Omnitrophota bacterium]
MRNRKGFTMVELLVVLVIVAILAAVATPIYLANVQRSRASEAVSTMALVRQGLRDYQVSGNSYFSIASGAANGTITNSLPTNVTAGIPAPLDAGVNIEDGVAQYFANTAFSVDTSVAGTGVGESQGFGGTLNPTSPPVVDFLITATGAVGANPGENTDCTNTVITNCAVKSGEVAEYLLEMDNSGRTYVCYKWDGTACGDDWALY